MKKICNRAALVNGVGLVSLLGVLLLAGCGGDRGEQARQIGDIHLRNNNLQEAEANYNKALAADPEDGLAQFGLANVYRLRDQNENALEGYNRALALDPSIKEAYVLAARIEQSQGRYDNARSYAERLREIDDLSGGLLLASVSRAAGNAADATALLEELKTEYPDSVPVRVGLAIDYMASYEPAKAEAELRAVVDTIDPTSVQARMALIDVYRAQGKLGEIETELRASIESAEAEVAVDPANAEAANRVATYKLQLGLALLQNNKVDEAIEVVEPVVRAEPDSPWANYVYGSCLAEAGQLAESLQALQAAATSLPDDPQIARRLALVRAQHETGEPVSRPVRVADEPAAGGETGIIAPDSRDWQSLWKSGSLQTLLRNRSRFASESDPTLSDILVLSAMIVGNQELVAELVERTSEESPMRKLDAALQSRSADQLRALMASWKETDAQREVVRANAEGLVYSVMGARGRALQTLLEVGQAHPDNGVAYYNIAAMYNAAGMHRFAAHSLERLLQMAPDSLETRVLLYQTQRRAGMDQEMRATAEATYGLFPESRDAILNLATTYLDNDEGELALKVLDRGSSRLSSDDAILIAYAAALLRTGAGDRVPEVLDSRPLEGVPAVRADELKGFLRAAEGDWEGLQASLSAIDSGAYSDGGRMLLVAALVRAGDAERAQELLDAGEAASPGLGRRAELLSLALGGSSEDGPSEDMASFVEALKNNPQAQSDYAYAIACMEGNMYRQAYDALLTLEAEVGQHPPIATLLLSSLAGSSSYADRVARAEQVASRYSGALTQIGLASVYARAGETAKQGEVLRAATEEDPGSETAWTGYALYLSANNQDEAAVAAYKKLIDLGSTRPEVFNNYAYTLLSVKGDPQVALDYAQRAVEGGMERQGQVVHTLGRAQLEAGQKEEAEQTLMAAASLLPGDPNIYLDLSRAFAAMDRTDQSKAVAQQAILHADMLGLDFPRREEAVALAGASEPE